MRTPRLFLGVIALALLLPLLLLACGSSDEPTDRPARATAEPTDMPDSQRATAESDTPASSARTSSTPRAGDAPTATDAPRPTATRPPLPTIGPTSAKTDRDALVALYNATNGEDWIFSYNWLSDAPLGQWSSVITNDDGRVTGLELWDNDLSGEIPAELGNLSNLTELNLSRNDLSGKIPAELGNLSNLTELNLSRNDLSGEIPAELGNLSNLTELRLFDNDLSGELPAELGSLSNLTHLYLWGNDFSGELPAELGSLSNLEILALGINEELSGCVPSSLEDQLDLDNSNRGGLPFC